MMNPLRSDTDTTTIVPLFMKITTDMLKLRLIGLTLLAFSAATAVHAEEKRYVSDELNTWVRSGPGDNYRLVGTVNAGEEVTLLQTNADTNYGQVRDSSETHLMDPAERAEHGAKPAHPRAGSGKSGENPDR